LLLQDTTGVNLVRPDINGQNRSDDPIKGFCWISNQALNIVSNKSSFRQWDRLEVFWD